MKLKKSEVESTPVAVLQVTKGNNVVAELRQFWTAKSGQFGYQIASQQWIGEEYHERKTSGCGYSKTQDDFNSFLIDLFGKYFSYCGDIDWLCRGSKYHVGGNFYRIPLSQLKKLVSK